MENTLGLIAGRGDLPEKIIQEYIRNNKAIFVISIDADNQPPSIKKVPHTVLNVGSVGKAIKNFRQAKVKDVVFAGGLNRPNFSSLRPDAGGIKLLAKISSAKLIGDNSLLSIVIKFFEDSGFNILGAEEILSDLLLPKGIMGKIEPNKSAYKDIEFGITIAKAIGNLDIGQSVIVQRGVVIGVEAIEGTDALITRCRTLLSGEPGGILVKMKKPSQDRRIDLPTIGPVTVENAHKSGLRGIAIEAGGALVVDKNRTLQKANELGLFIIGV